MRRGDRGVAAMSLDFEYRWHEEYLANTGGPATRRRTERVLASVLRAPDHATVRLHGTLRLGLRFGSGDPLVRVLDALARASLDDAEQLRERHPLPPAPMLVRTVPDAPWAKDAAALPDDALLSEALLLGLCTPHQYDPARPVIWTRASLTRCVELYAPEGFYA
jgi:hypothetical protein